MPVSESWIMAKKKKIKPFRAVKAVKALARENIGAPPPTYRQENTRKPAPPRHKERLDKLIEDAE